MQALSAEEIQRLFADGIVRHGPFAGLCYPVLTSICSSLYPKLLGSYEAEIHPWIEEICRTGYTEVINVGCGEGYYAVGLALRLPRARVLAYDVYPEAQRLCAEMAEANGVAERVEVRGAFTPDELEFIPIRERGLILCDCEGCESHVFTADSMPRYAGWDLLIETHDFVEITISTRLTELLQPSQNLRTVLSVDDIQKAKTYAYPELDGLDLATRRAILAECRPTIMEWLFLRTAQPEAPV